MRTVTESMQIAVDLLTALGALGAFAVSLWNAHRIGRVNTRVDGLETTHNAHVNAPGLRS